MVFNATFNNISVISWQQVLLVEETTDLSQVTDKLYHIIGWINKGIQWLCSYLRSIPVYIVYCIFFCNSNDNLFEILSKHVIFFCKIFRVFSNLEWYFLSFTGCIYFGKWNNIAVLIFLNAKILEKKGCNK
jgi:hypothetical protein